jgi:hypothetical protein
VAEHVPVGHPIKLDSELYSLVLEEFLTQKDFGNLLMCVERFKPHLLDYTNISKLLHDTYDQSNDFIKNSLFFQAMLKIAEYTDNKMGLFLMFLKSKSLRAFDIQINDPGTCNLTKL